MNIMKNKKYQTVGTVPNSTEKKIADRGEFDTFDAQIHDCSPTGLKQPLQ